MAIPLNRRAFTRPRRLSSRRRSRYLVIARRGKCKLRRDKPQDSRARLPGLERATVNRDACNCSLQLVSWLLYTYNALPPSRRRTMCVCS